MAVIPDCHVHRQPASRFIGKILLVSLCIVKLLFITNKPIFLHFIKFRSCSAGEQLMTKTSHAFIVEAAAMPLPALLPSSRRLYCRDEAIE
jgi:hypothetical protein